MTKSLLEYLSCSKCTDTNISMKEHDEGKIDYYGGCESFPEKQKVAIELPELESYPTEFPPITYPDWSY